MNTLQQIIEKMEWFADHSAAISEYNCDDFTRFAASDHDYPLLWTTPLSMRITDGQISWVTQVSFMDTVHEKQDMIKTLSDVGITVAEFFAYLSVEADDCYFYLVTDTVFTPFFRQVDNVTGWQGEAVFNTKYLADTNTIRWS